MVKTFVESATVAEVTSCVLIAKTIYVYHVVSSAGNVFIKKNSLTINKVTATSHRAVLVEKGMTKVNIRMIIRIDQYIIITKSKWQSICAWDVWPGATIAKSSFVTVASNVSATFMKRVNDFLTKTFL